MLAGMMIVFLNLDEVIRIIREEEDPKAELVKKYKLTEAQVNYILDTRLRALRRLEELELRREESELKKEKSDIEKLLGDEKKQWQTVAYQIRDTKKKYGLDTPLGRRRTIFEDAPDVVVADLAEALVEREPVTIVVSEKGWIRALKGHIEDLSTLAFKGDDKLKVSFPAETTSKILVVATNGKVFTLDASKLPGGRGHGEPIRLFAEIDEDADIAAVLLYKQGAKALIAATDGRGFVVGHDDMLSSTRKGRAVLVVDTPAEAAVVTAAEGDHVATIGQNRKMLIFPLEQVPEMARGKGVRLQRYKDGGLSDARVFALKEGLTWRDLSGRIWTVEGKELKDWIGNRAEAGRLPPKGFPRSNKFG
jgi:topoisomerase-4 subunit A